jgi:hypothetical protein
LCARYGIVLVIPERIDLIGIVPPIFAVPTFCPVQDVLALWTDRLGIAVLIE